MRRMININTRELVKILEREGWYLVRKRGSHHIYKHDENPSILSVPYRSCNISLPLASKFLKIAGLSREKVTA